RREGYAEVVGWIANDDRLTGAQPLIGSDPGPELKLIHRVGLVRLTEPIKQRAFRWIGKDIRHFVARPRKQEGDGGESSWCRDDDRVSQCSSGRGIRIARGLGGSGEDTSNHDR